jgi:hypothetical protein
LLLFAWLGELGRATRDVDLLGLGDLSDDTLLSLMQTVCRQPVDDDGMVFDPATIRIGDIRVEDPHGGRRVSLTGRLGAGRIRVQVDVGMGDAMVPEPDWLDLPVLLDAPAPRLRVYRPETVVAEKFHAVVRLGVANTRLKDFYDLVALAQTHSFDGEALRAAIEATFDRRQTEVPIRIPPGLTADFASDGRRRQWAAFVTRNDLQAAPDLGAALQTIESFLGPITWMRYEGHSPMAWTPEGGWQTP